MALWEQGHCEVKLNDVEHTAIVDLGDVHEVTLLVPFVDDPHALANDEHILQLPLIVLWPFFPNFITRVEELCLGGAYGAHACGERTSDHGENEASLNFLYSIYKFLP
jgi:hypothetical protein